MKISDLIKLNFMILALAGVIYVIIKLNDGSMNRGLGVIFGLPEGVSPSVATRPGKVITTFDWCDTRVTALRREGRPELRQEKLKWLWITADAKFELNFIAVEKWFGRYCRVQVERAAPQPTVSGTESVAMVVEFIKGQPETLFRSGKGVFRWRDEWFRSPELETALVELDKLPDAGIRTTR